MASAPTGIDVTEPPHHDDVTSDEEDEDRRRKAIFFWILSGVALVILIVIVFSLSGSGDDAPLAGTAPPETAPPETAAAPEPTIDGIWTMTIDVTVATGACRGEEGEEVTPDTVTIRQDGDTFTILGLGFPKEEQVWQGRIDGNLVTFEGKRSEDSGTTAATFTMEVDFENFTMTGREDWSWEGPGGTCPNSESLVTAVRIGP